MKRSQKSPRPTSRSPLQKLLGVGPKRQSRISSPTNFVHLTHIDFQGGRFTGSSPQLSTLLTEHWNSDSELNHRLNPRRERPSLTHSRTSTYHHDHDHYDEDLLDRDPLHPPLRPTTPEPGAVRRMVTRSAGPELFANCYRY